MARKRSIRQMLEDALDALGDDDDDDDDSEDEPARKAKRRGDSDGDVVILRGKAADRYTERLASASRKKDEADDKPGDDGDAAGDEKDPPSESTPKRRGYFTET
jgi:hypothetical protein